MKRKLISLLLSISIALTAIPYYVIAAEDSILIDDIAVDSGDEYITSEFNSEQYLEDNTNVKELEEYNIERLDTEEAERQNALIPYRYEGVFDSIPEIEFISDDIEDGLAQSIENLNDDEDGITSNHYAAAVNSTKYDSRNYGIVSKVKNQGIYGTCWAHSALSEVETAVLKSRGTVEPDYSERHLAYFAYHDGNDKVGLSKGVTSVVAPSGTDYLNIGGNDIWAASRLMNSMGAAAETAYPYSKVTTAISKEHAQDYSSFVSGYYFVPTSSATVEQKIETIKSLITQFGVVGWAYCSENAYYTYNSDSTAYYCNLNARTNHAITVVGWDDDYSRYNFKSSCRPKYDGAFLCKNSWGTNWGKNGYFYISYYDTTLGNGSNASVVTADKLDFDNNYYYTNAMPLSMCSVTDRAYQYFTVTGEAVQTLTAVSFMSATTNMPYSVQIYKNPLTSKPESGQPLLKEEVSGVTGYVGYYSVDIPNVELSRGDVFVVAIKCKGYLYADSSFSFMNYKYVVNPTAGISFSGSTDIGRQGTIFRINALTLNGSMLDDENDDEEQIEIEEVSESVTKKQIENCKIILAGNGTYEYTGYSVRPEVSVFSESNEKLIEGTDYIVRYKNNRNSYEYYVGDGRFNESLAPCVEITGKGDYEGKNSIYFAIKGKKNESGTEVVNIPMSKVKIELSKAVTYTGGDITIENNSEDLNVILSYMDIPLTEYDRESGLGDYTVSYEKNIKAGIATITFVGKGVYTGSVKKKFKINPYKMTDGDNNISVYMGDEFTYEKGGIKPLAEVYFKGELLKMGVDYNLSYKNNLNVNDATAKNAPTVIIKGKGNFSGTINKTFTINKKDLKDVDMNAPGKIYANRKNANSSVPVLVDTNGKKLLKGKDYDKITYTYVEDTEVSLDSKNPVIIQRYTGDEVLKSDILSPGTKVLVTVTGKGNYVGENSTEYTIYSVSIAKAKIDIVEKVFNGNAVTVGNEDISVTYNGETLIEGTDYKIVGYTNNLKPGTARVTIWGTGEFGASKTATFKIVK